MDDNLQARSPSELMEAAAAEEGKARYLLRLYIAGPTVQSTRAVVNIRRICEEHLKGRHDLEILDLIQNPGIASTDQIVAAPTLVRISPPPVRRFIGDLSQTGRILKGLDLADPNAPDPASGPEAIS